jgi:hypothetical protein
MKSPPAGQALLLFAHGARDERWAEPFARIVSKVRAAAPGLLVELAYLEHLEPSLEQASRRLAKLGASTIPGGAALSWVAAVTCGSTCHASSRP